jgi:NAD-dependent DNA ligase
MEKFNEFVETGTLKIIEKEKLNPINILGDVYGIGPKKAEELLNLGIKNIDDLRNNQSHLNDVQKIGLKYYEDIQKRIPRSEIEEYKKIFMFVFNKIKDNDNQKLEIVGSYRRGLNESGDIDVIITSNTNNIYNHFVNELTKQNIIIEILSRGQFKTLVIARIPSSKLSSQYTARRIDFLYTPPTEYAFATLYFTGSKVFNTIMRQNALNQGYTLNEHGIYFYKDKKKGEKVENVFYDEESIFKFLNMEYKTPQERNNIPLLCENAKHENSCTNTNKTSHKKTLKKRTKNKILQSTFSQQEQELTKIIEPPDIQSLIIKFKKSGIIVLQNLSIEVLLEMINYANKMYFNETPIMTDNEFDIIKDFTTNKFPNSSSKLNNLVGSDVERNKVELPYEMASMNKIKPDTNSLGIWTSKYKGSYLITCKLDGVSGLYTTKNDTAKLYTRGNGIIGQDVSYLIPYLRLPKTKNITIRGEFIIQKDIFKKKYQDKFANPRNMVAGIINQKSISNIIHDIHFVAYEVIEPQLIPYEQIQYLSTLNVEPVFNMCANEISNDLLSNLLIKWRNEYIYEIDGIVVTDNKIYERKPGNPDHSFAFKMVLSEQMAEAKVLDVIWTPSKDGYLKPRVQIEPINLGGVCIEYATGFNAAFIRDNKIGIGATIQIIRSGDVIPHIKSIIIPALEPKMPDVPFQWNETHVDIMLINLDDPIVKEKNITCFFKGLGVECLSSGYINRLINTGYDSVSKILSMKEHDFLKIDGFKEKMANKIYNGIQEKINNASLITLMSASNLFGRGISEKKIEIILQELPNILTSNDNATKKINDITAIKGMGEKTSQLFVSKIANFIQFLNESGLNDKLKLHSNVLSQLPKTMVNKNNPFYKKQIILTGTRDKQIIEMLKNNGAIIGSNVTKNTFLVIAKSVDDDTGKAEEAKKLNIPIMEAAQFIDKYIIC